MNKPIMVIELMEQRRIDCFSRCHDAKMDIHLRKQLMLFRR